MGYIPETREDNQSMTSLLERHLNETASGGEFSDDDEEGEGCRK